MESILQTPYRRGRPAPPKPTSVVQPAKPSLEPAPPNRDDSLPRNRVDNPPVLADLATGAGWANAESAENASLSTSPFPFGEPHRSKRLLCHKSTEAVNLN